MQRSEIVRNASAGRYCGPKVHGLRLVSRIYQNNAEENRQAKAKVCCRDVDFILSLEHPHR